MAPSSLNDQRATFSFSQASLQDYVDCRRRFQLRYLQKVAWPAIESEPALENERAMQQGALFHRLVQQHLLGIPAERLTPLAQGEDLTRWWTNYLDAVRDLPALFRPSGVKRYPEITLSAPFGSHRLLAKYDLISITPNGRMTIFDWKTSRKRPKRPWLLERLQTRVYPFLLVQAGGFLLPSKENGLHPEDVEMIYWFAESPRQPERIQYNKVQYQQDLETLNRLIGEITSLSDDAFTLTTHEERCSFCNYRSLCDRGGQAGELNDAEAADLEAETSPTLDFEQIAEIEF